MADYFDDADKAAREYLVTLLCTIDSICDCDDDEHDDPELAGQRWRRKLEVTDADREHRVAYSFGIAGPDLKLVKDFAALLGRLAERGFDDSSTEAWTRLRRAYDHVSAGLPAAAPTRDQLRLNIVEAIALAVDQLRELPQELASGSGYGQDMGGDVAYRLVRRLREIDPAFEALDESVALKELARTKPASEVAKGGATNVGPVRCAARLCASVKAFGDKSEEQSKTRFHGALKRQRSKQSPSE